MSTTSIPQEDTIVAMSRRDELKRVQLQLDQIQKELSTLIMTPTNSIETVTKEVECESDFMSSQMTKMLEAMIEYDKLDDESSPSETHDITLSPSAEDFKSEYHLWTTPLPPSYGDSFKTSHPHKLKRSPFAHTFRKPHFAKPKGVQDRNPWDVLYDTYYGQKLLFEDLWRRRVKLDVKRSTSWEATQGKYS